MDNSYIIPSFFPSDDISLSFRDVGYTVTSKKKVTRILSGISGYVPAGKFLAILGPSGAGKSTLLDVLAGRQKAGKISGEIHFNDDVRPRDFLQRSAYVMQDEALLGNLTPRETLLYALNLRVPSSVLNKHEKRQRICTLLKDLNLSKVADSRIGTPLKRGISGGERRRLSIGVEIVTGPKIVFLDEPTTGLDSTNALRVMKSLKNLCEKYNVTVICTIHQPRSNIFYLFDYLLLLGEGKMVYYGEAMRSITYFEMLGLKCPQYMNPADYLLDILEENYANHHHHHHSPHSGESQSASSSLIRNNNNDDDKSITQSYGAVNYNNNNSGGSGGSSGGNHHSSSGNNNKSTNHQLLSSIELQDLENGVNGDGGANSNDDDDDDDEGKHLLHDHQYIDFPSEYQRSEEYKQLISILDHQKYKGRSGSGGGGGGGGDQHSNMEKFEERIPLVSLFTQTSELLSRVWRNTIRDSNIMYLRTGAALAVAFLVGIMFWQSTGSGEIINSILFLMCVFSLFCLPSISKFIEERVIFSREHASGYYGTYPYLMANFFVEIPILAFTVLAYGTISYWMVGYYAHFSNFIFFLGIIFLVIQVGYGTCQFIASVVSTVNVAVAVYIIYLVYSLLLGGFIIPQSEIPEKLEWLVYTSYFYYGFAGLMVNEYSDGSTSGTAELNGLNLEDTNKFVCFFVLFFTWILLKFFEYLGLRFVNKELK